MLQIWVAGCRLPGKIKCSGRKCFKLLKKVASIRTGKGRMLVIERLPKQGNDF